MQLCIPHRTDQAGIGCAIQGYAGSTQRRSKMHQTGIHTDNTAGSRNHRRKFTQLHARQHLNPLMSDSNLFGTLLLDCATPGDLHLPTIGGCHGRQFHPVFIRPVLGRPGGAMQEDQTGLPLCCCKPVPDTVVGRDVGHCIFQCCREQLPDTCYGMLGTRHRESPAIGTCRQRLTGTGAVKPVARTPRKA